MIQAAMATGKDQHAIGPPRPKGLDHLLLDGDVIVRRRKEGRVAAFGELAFNSLRHGRQHGIGKVGQDQPD